MSTPTVSNPHHHLHDHVQPDWMSIFTGRLGVSYNTRTGGCNIEVAQHILKLLLPHLPSNQALRILDNACGPLVFTNILLATLSFSSTSSGLHISAVDLSPDFIAANKETLATSPLYTSLPENINVDTEVMDAQSLSFPDNEFHASVTSIAIFTLPDPIKGARELHRTLKPGGVAILTTWKQVGWMPILHAAEEIVRPAVKEQGGKGKTLFPAVEAWSVPGKLEETLREAGFEDVTMGDMLAHAWFKDVGQMAECFSETLRLMVGSGWKEEEKAGLKEAFESVLGGSRAGELGLERDEAGRAGMRMEAWTAVATKK